jgi:hypothetical protein
MALIIRRFAADVDIRICYGAPDHLLSRETDQSVGVSHHSSAPKPIG